MVPPANLVYLVDVSGSMRDPNKLPLLKNALNLLIDRLRDQDKVSLVVYAGASGVVLEPTSGKEKAKLRAAILADPGLLKRVEAGPVGRASKSGDVGRGRGKVCGSGGRGRRGFLRKSREGDETEAEAKNGNLHAGSDEVRRLLGRLRQHRAEFFSFLRIDFQRRN